MLHNNGFNYMRRTLQRKFHETFDPSKTNTRKLLTELDLDVSRKLSEMAHAEDMDTGPFAAELLSNTIKQLSQDIENKIARWQELTPREKEVAALACQGLTNPEIAKKLFISEETVKKHMSHTIGKFEVKGRGILKWLLMDWNFNNPEAPWES